MTRRRPFSRRLGTYGALMLLGAHGCGGGSCDSCSRDDAKAEKTGARDEAAKGQPEDLSLPPGTDIEMLALGDAPRVYLRVARWEGLRYRAELRTAGTVGVVGQPAVAGPGLTMRFLYEVLRGSANPIERPFDGGVHRLVEERAVLESATFQSDEAPPEVLAASNRQLAAFDGSTMRQLITETGAIESLTLERVGGMEPTDEVRKATDAALEQQRHFPFRLPPIPVGVGAKWRFKENVTFNGVIAVQAAVMALRSLDDDVAHIRVTVRMQAPRQTVPHPLEPGNTAMLEVFRGDGDGEITLDRLTGIPLDGRLATSARLTLRGELAGQPAEATLMGSNVVILDAKILGRDDDGGNDTVEIEGGT